MVVELVVLVVLLESRTIQVVNLVMVLIARPTGMAVRGLVLLVLAAKVFSVVSVCHATESQSKTLAAAIQTAMVAMVDAVVVGVVKNLMLHWKARKSRLVNQKTKPALE
jgi:ribonuclease PH